MDHLHLKAASDLHRASQQSVDEFYDQNSYEGWHRLKAGLRRLASALAQSRDAAPKSTVLKGA